MANVTSEPEHQWSVITLAPEMFALETAIWEIFARGTIVYLALALVIRIIPKRHTGNLAPNDLVALIVVGNLAGYAIIGQARSIPDVLLLVCVVLAWDHGFNMAEYHLPKLRGITQDSPTLLIHDGVLLKANLKKEKLTEQELAASLRKRGVADLSRVRQLSYPLRSPRRCRAGSHAPGAPRRKPASA